MQRLDEVSNTINQTFLIDGAFHRKVPDLRRHVLEAIVDAILERIEEGQLAEIWGPDFAQHLAQVFGIGDFDLRADNQFRDVRNPNIITIAGTGCSKWMKMIHQVDRPWIDCDVGVELLLELGEFFVVVCGGASESRSGSQHVVDNLIASSDCLK